MKKIIPLLFLASINYTLLSGSGSFQKDTFTNDETDSFLTKEEFNTLVRNDLYKINGFNGTQPNSFLKMSLDEKEKYISPEFQLYSSWNNAIFKYFIKGGGKIGDASGIYSLNTFRMPIKEVKLNFNIVLNTKLWYSGDSIKKLKQNNSKFYIKDSSIEMKSGLLTHKRYRWVSAELKYINTDYKILQSFSIPQPKVLDTTYSTLSSTITYNVFASWETKYFKDGKYKPWLGFKKWRPRYIFFNLNYNVKKSNNTGQFDLKEVSEIKTIQDSITGTQYLLNGDKQYVYEGIYKEYLTHTFSIDAIIGLSNIISLNTFASYQTGSEMPKDKISGGVCLFFTIVDSKKTSIINLGPFVQYNNLSKPFYGVKTTLPIQF